VVIGDLCHWKEASKPLTSDSSLKLQIRTNSEKRWVWSYLNTHECNWVDDPSSFVDTREVWGSSVTLQNSRVFWHRRDHRPARYETTPMRLGQAGLPTSCEPTSELDQEDHPSLPPVNDDTQICLYLSDCNFNTAIVILHRSRHLLCLRRHRLCCRRLSCCQP